MSQNKSLNSDENLSQIANIMYNQIVRDLSYLTLDDGNQVYLRIMEKLRTRCMNDVKQLKESRIRPTVK